MKIKIICSICLLVVLQLLSIKSNSQELVELRKIKDFSTEDLLGMKIAAKNGVEAYKLIYTTIDFEQKKTTASGLLLIPIIDDLKNASMVVFHHGATLNRKYVPSNLNFQAEQPGLFASNGYIALAPDYLGLGDGPGLHPYMHAETEATASVDMIRAVRKVFKKNYQIKLKKDLYLTGYSQGAHAAMALHKYIEEHKLTREFKIKGSAPSAGPYDMAGVTWNYVLYCIDNYGNFDSEILINLMACYQKIYGNLYDDLSDYYIHPYDSVINNYFLSDCSININPLLPRELYSFMHKSVWDDIRANSDHPLRKALEKNNLDNWKPIAPLKMFYSKGDEKLPYQNSLNTYHKMKELGAKNVSVQKVSDTLRHDEGMTENMKQVLVWFNRLSGKE